MPDSKLVVGIDLGTTHTVVASARREANAEVTVFEVPQLVSTGEVGAQPLLPSFLYAPLPGEVPDDPFGDAPFALGEVARRRAQEVPGRVIASAKSWLSHAAVDRTAAILPWGAAEQDPAPRISPVEASARLLAHVRRAWDVEHPSAPLAEQEVVLTVPASFDQAARLLTLQAARDAGLAVRLLEEPQAAFYDTLAHLGPAHFDQVLGEATEALVLVCDIGGGTTDLTLIRLSRAADGGLGLDRVAVGRHLLLGGDNMDLALAHVCEARWVTPPERLEARRFAQLVAACRDAKERLLSDGAPDSAPIALVGSGSALVGSTLRTELSRADTERLVLDGFLPRVGRDELPKRGRSGLLAFGLPYEHDAAITRHLAAFVARHTPAEVPIRALLFNGGVFRAALVAERVLEVVRSWSDAACERLPERDPDLAVARGAVAYGLALGGHGLVIGGGAAQGFYIGVDDAKAKRAVCVVPRGAREGERHIAAGRPLALRVGRPVQFELYSADHAVHTPGELVELDDERFTRLPPVASTFEARAGGEEVLVALEGELSQVGTLELSCIESAPADPKSPRRFALAFELRAPTESNAEPRLSERPRPSVRPESNRFDEAKVAIERVFGPARADVKDREVKDLWRELTRVLGERQTWSAELCRALFDEIAPLHKARKRSVDHERVFWMFAGYCLRPGYGHPLDPGRIRTLSPLFEQGLVFQDEARGWQQFWIAWRRMAGGLAENLQSHIRDRVDPFLAPAGQAGKKPKGMRPQALDEMLELASALERVPRERRSALGEWLLERTWTEQNPRLWAAIGRLGARAPAYASLHHVIPTRVAEGWLDHLLREKWSEVATAPRAGMLLARATGDRTRDVRPELAERTARALAGVNADAEWIRAVREVVPIEDRERAEFFGEEIPRGLRLAE
ncbi:MAG: hsp70 family protein [Myxococcales bacterium]|nr:hsp70 family protein [Myxococcales bacterium]